MSVQASGTHPTISNTCWSILDNIPRQVTKWRWQTQLERSAKYLSNPRIIKSTGMRWSHRSYQFRLARWCDHCKGYSSHFHNFVGMLSQFQYIFGMDFSVLSMPFNMSYNSRRRTANEIPLLHTELYVKGMNSENKKSTEFLPQMLLQDRRKIESHKLYFSLKRDTLVLQWSSDIKRNEIRWLLPYTAREGM